jgi:hypothetical protein
VGAGVAERSPERLRQIETFIAALQGGISVDDDKNLGMLGLNWIVYGRGGGRRELEVNNLLIEFDDRTM